MFEQSFGDLHHQSMVSSTDWQKLLLEDPSAVEAIQHIFNRIQVQGQEAQQAETEISQRQIPPVISQQQPAPLVPAPGSSISQFNPSAGRPMQRSKFPQATTDGIFVEITEQPKQRGLRFRYECEGRSAGSIPGERTTAERKTYPTIKIHNYSGTAVVVVSCVCKDSPHDPHPHNLVGRDCKKGVCTIKVKDTNTISFPHLGIQCAKKKDVEGNLKQRKEINVDPFQSGFKHMSKISNIDLNVVRLCFQVFLPDASGKISRIVPPVVSQPIHDKKALNDLIICRIDKTSGRARGGEEVFLLCEKINRADDIQVRFFRKDDYGGASWEDYGDFTINDIHRQFAIVFKTPSYRDRYITQPVEVEIQLKRTSDGETSESVPFTYMPEDPDPDRIIDKKKRKIDYLKNFGIDANNSNENDIKARLKNKAIRSKIIRQENEGVDVPMYSLENLTGNSPLPAPPITTGSAGMCTTAMETFGSMSTNLIAADNNNVNQVAKFTISPSVNEQLTNCPPDVRAEILRQLMIRKLPKEFIENSQQTSVSQNVSQIPVQYPTQTISMINSGSNVLLHDVNMPQLPSNGQEIASSIEASLQALITEQAEVGASFDSIEGLSGELFQIAAEESVITEEKDETAQAIRGLNMS